MIPRRTYDPAKKMIAARRVATFVLNSRDSNELNLDDRVRLTKVGKPGSRQERLLPENAVFSANPCHCATLKYNSEK
jgi:hypothetical protein